MTNVLPTHQDLPSDSPDTDRAGVLRDTCRGVAELIATAPGPLRRMHVRVADVTVEVEWPDHCPEQSTAPPAASLSARTGGVAAVDRPTPADGALDGERMHHLCAPGVGTYYRAPQPDAPSFVQVGDRVEPGQQIGILECMKLMIPIEADRAGLVKRIVVDNGEAVEFGQPLISIDPG